MKKQRMRFGCDSTSDPVGARYIAIGLCVNMVLVVEKHLHLQLKTGEVFTFRLSCRGSWAYKEGSGDRIGRSPFALGALGFTCSRL